MLRLRKVEMADGTIMFSCKVTLEATCPLVTEGGESGLDLMMSELVSKVSVGLSRLSKNIEDCDEAKIDSAGNLHTKTAEDQPDAEDEGGDA